jgi:hypothetical protein
MYIPWIETYKLLDAYVKCFTKALYVRNYDNSLQKREEVSMAYDDIASSFTAMKLVIRQLVLY